DMAAKERGAALLAQLAATGVALYEVSPTTLERLADTQSPQGILAVFHTPVWRVEQMGAGLVILLDGLQDPGNLGTIIRSLEAMGGAGLAIAGGVDPFNPKVVRSAMGSLFRLPLVKDEVAPLIDQLRAQGRTVYVADAGGSLTPWTADLKGSSVLVIGNEGAGPSETARQMADAAISIPMPGPTESLNAGVAASLLIYEAMRQRMG
ncbi:MAG: TrmH family RNA methyltransferase, partial [Mycobacterium leprae]